MKYIIATKSEPFGHAEYYGKNGFGPRDSAIEYADRFEAYRTKLDLELEDGRNRKIVITRTRRW